MTEEKTRLFAIPMWYHDAQQAQKLVYKGNIEAGLRIRGRNLPRHLPFSQSCRPRRIEEKPSVCIEGHRFGGMYLDFGRRRPV